MAGLESLEPDGADIAARQMVKRGATHGAKPDHNHVMRHIRLPVLLRSDAITASQKRNCYPCDDPAQMPHSPETSTWWDVSFQFWLR